MRQHNQKQQISCVCGHTQNPGGKTQNDTPLSLAMPNLIGAKSQKTVRSNHAIGSAEEAPPIRTIISLLQRPVEIPPFWARGFYVIIRNSTLSYSITTLREIYIL